MGTSSSLIRIDRSVSLDQDRDVMNFFRFLNSGKATWVIDKHQDVRSLGIAEINLEKILLVHMLRLGEECISWGERAHRMEPFNYIRLDIRIFAAVWRNRYCLPERFKEKISGSVPYILFDGTTLRIKTDHPISQKRAFPRIAWESDDWRSLLWFADSPVFDSVPSAVLEP